MRWQPTAFRRKSPAPHSCSSEIHTLLATRRGAPTVDATSVHNQLRSCSTVSRSWSVITSCRCPTAEPTPSKIPLRCAPTAIAECILVLRRRTLSGSVGEPLAKANFQEERFVHTRLCLTILAMAGTPIVYGANSCSSAPLPTTPVGPTSSVVWRASNSDSPVYATIWRIPCSATDSMVVVTLTPSPGATSPFICYTSITLFQAGWLQTTAFNLRTDPPTNSNICRSVVSTVTAALVPTSATPAAVDFDQGFSLDYDGTSSGHHVVAVSAYNPAAYNLTPPSGPNSANVFVGGKNVLFQNCTVASAPVVGVTQYTASRALESPVKASGFERHDY